MKDEITLRAHFDGQQIQLDDPFELKPNTRLIVTVITDESVDEDQADWAILSQKVLSNAYGEDEPEYSLDMIKEQNPEYERR